MPDFCRSHQRIEILIRSDVVMLEFLTGEYCAKGPDPTSCGGNCDGMDMNGGCSSCGGSCNNTCQGMCTVHCVGACAGGCSQCMWWQLRQRL